MFLDVVPFGYGAAKGAIKVGHRGLLSLVSKEMLDEEFKRFGASMTKKLGKEFATTLSSEQFRSQVRREIIEVVSKETTQVGGRTLAIGGLAFAFGPVAQQALAISSDPSLTPQQRRNAIARLAEELVPVAANMLITQTLQTTLKMRGEHARLNIKDYRGALLDPEIRARVNEETRITMERLGVRLDPPSRASSTVAAPEMEGPMLRIDSPDATPKTIVRLYGLEVQGSDRSQVTHPVLGVGVLSGQ